MIQTGSGQQNLPTPDVDEMLKDLVKACEGDPFLIQSQFAELTSAMPAGLQLSLLEGLLLADDSSLREAAMGWLLAGTEAGLLGQRHSLECIRTARWRPRFGLDRNGARRS